jgi:hypothetical protein
LFVCSIKCTADGLSLAGSAFYAADKLLLFLFVCSMLEKNRKGGQKK